MFCNVNIFIATDLLKSVAMKTSHEYVLERAVKSMANTCGVGNRSAEHHNCGIIGLLAIKSGE